MHDVDLTKTLMQKMNSRPRTRGRYNSSELYFINNGSTAPQAWLNQPERTVKEVLTMWAGIGMHNQIQDVLGGKDFKEEKREFKYKGITLVGKSDFLPTAHPDEVWEFKTSEKKMDKAKPWHLHQVGLYTTMFEKSVGRIYQPVQDENGLYLKHLGAVNRNDTWFEGQMEKLYQFHLKVEELWGKI